MTAEHWVEAAMSDDAMVVDLLMTLSRRTPPPPQKSSSSLAEMAAALPLEWSVRQRRSKPSSASDVSSKKLVRGSPNTPLSWSGAATSGSGGGEEESSRLIPSPISRSKVIETSEKTTTNKKSRRKKTLAELKEEEAMLLKERRQLKKELANIRLNLDRQRATNEDLKRIKLELQPNQQEEERVMLPDLNIPLEEEALVF